MSCELLHWCYWTARLMLKDGSEPSSHRVNVLFCVTLCARLHITSVWLLQVTIRHRRRRRQLPVTVPRLVGETARRWMQRRSKRGRGDLLRAIMSWDSVDIATRRPTLKKRTFLAGSTVLSYICRFTAAQIPNWRPLECKTLAVLLTSSPSVTEYVE